MAHTAIQTQLAVDDHRKWLNITVNQLQMKSVKIWMFSWKKMRAIRWSIKKNRTTDSSAVIGVDLVTKTTYMHTVDLAKMISIIDANAMNFRRYIRLAEKRSKMLTPIRGLKLDVSLDKFSKSKWNVMFLIDSDFFCNQRRCIVRTRYFWIGISFANPRALLTSCAA